MSERKKGKSIIAVVAAALIIIAIIVVFRGSSGSIVGTWYSNKPDSITFTKDGKYESNSWNNGSPWLSDGTYTIKGDTLTLNGVFDGTTVFTIGKDELVGTYTYYRNEKAALAAVADLISKNKETLLGEWISVSGRGTCTYTENTLTLFLSGKEVLCYEYKVLDGEKMEITKDGKTEVRPYSLFKEDGVWYLNSPVRSYARLYKKVDTQSTGGD